MNKTKRYSLDLNKWFTICIFLGTYIIPGTGSTSFGETLLFLAVMFVVFYGFRGMFPIKFAGKRTLIFLAVYMVFNQLLIYAVRLYSTTNVLKNLMMNIIGIMIILVLSTCLDEDKLYDTYRMIGIITHAGLIYHSIQVYILGNKIEPLFIPFMDAFIPIHSVASANMRPCSFFTEPQGYCSFVAPLLILSIKRKDYFMAIVTSICMILSTSSTGVFLVAVIWLYYIFFQVKSIPLKVICIILAIGVGVWLFANPYLSYTFDKITTINLADNERTGKGFYILSHMSFPDLMLGTGVSNLESYLQQNRNAFSDIRSVTENNYVTTGFGFFIQYGFIGGVSYLLLCAQMIASRNKWARLAAILILITSFTQTIAFNNWGVLWFSIYEMLRKQEETNCNRCVVEGESL